MIIITSCLVVEYIFTYIYKHIVVESFIDQLVWFINLFGCVCATENVNESKKQENRKKVKKERSTVISHQFGYTTITVVHRILENMYVIGYG